jgi:ubiquinol-cytochrome c reductase cytochrome c subunit
LEGCASCHGLRSEGTNVGPSLRGVGSAAVHFQVSTGRMPLAQPGPQAPSKTPSYSESEIESLARYVATLGPGPAIPTQGQLDFESADLARGGALFRTNCAQCHNFAGRGGALTRGKQAPPLMKASAQQIYEAMITGPQNMPVFGEATVPVKDKQAIIKFIKNLQEEPSNGGLTLGAFGPVTEGLFLFVFGLVILVGMAIWIGAKAR